MRNVCDLLVLGDEYQVAKVTKECHKFLMSARLNDQMAMKVLLLANKCGLTDLRTKCCGQLSFVEPYRLEQLAGFQDLDADTMKEVLVPHLERAKEFCATLQASLNEVLPQLVGFLELTVYLIKSNKDFYFETCPIHYSGSGKANSEFWHRFKNCTACQAMFKAIPRIGHLFGRNTYAYGHDHHIDEQIIQLLPKLMSLQDEYFEVHSVPF